MVRTAWPVVAPEVVRVLMGGYEFYYQEGMAVGNWRGAADTCAQAYQHARGCYKRTESAAWLEKMYLWYRRGEHLQNERKPLPFPALPPSHYFPALKVGEPARLRTLRNPATSV